MMVWKQRSDVDHDFGADTVRTGVLPSTRADERPCPPEVSATGVRAIRCVASHVCSSACASVRDYDGGDSVTAAMTGARRSSRQKKSPPADDCGSNITQGRMFG